MNFKCLDSFNKMKGVLFGNGFGLIVSIASQFALVPIIINFWGAEGYGKWVFYYSIPTFVTFYGSSFMAVGSNQAVMAAAQDDNEKSKEVTAKTTAVVALITIAAICCALILFAGFPGVFSEQNVETSTLILVMVAALLGIVSYGAEGIYRSKKIFGRCLFVFNISRLIETGSIIVAVVLSKSIQIVTIVVIFNKLLFIWFLLIDTRKRACEYTPSLAHIRGKQTKIRPLFFASVHSMGNGISNMIRQSAVVPLVSSQLGLTLVGQFQAARTLAKLPGFLILIINNSVKAELTSLYAPESENAFKSLNFKCTIIVSITSLLSILLFAAFGDFMVKIWLGKQNSLPHTLLLIAVVQVCIEGILSSIVNPLLATNLHRIVSWIFLLTTLLATYLATNLLQKYGSASILGAYIIVDFLLIIIITATGMVNKNLGFRKNE